MIMITEKEVINFKKKFVKELKQTRPYAIPRFAVKEALKSRKASLKRLCAQRGAPYPEFQSVGFGLYVKTSDLKLREYDELLLVEKAYETLLKSHC